MKKLQYTKLYPWMLSIKGIKSKDELYLFATLYGLTKFSEYGYVEPKDVMQIGEYLQIDGNAASKAVNSLVHKGLVRTYFSQNYRFFYVDLEKFSEYDTDARTA